MLVISLAFYLIIIFKSQLNADKSPFQRTYAAQVLHHLQEPF
jgi:hypothetical protein